MLDPKEEQRYERLRKLAQELHIPVPEAFLTLEVFGKDGKLVQRHHQRSHSWVRSAYNLLFTQLAGKGCTGDGFGAGKISAKRYPDGIVLGEDGAPLMISGDASPDGYTKGYRAPAGEDGWGILVGSGTNAESFEDYVLQTPIAEGSGGGQLNHVASEAHAYTYAALVGTNTLIRYLNNNSGGNVDVNEVALVTYGGMSAVFHHWMQSRDKLGATVTVPSTGQLKVTYTIQLTYPE